LAYSLGEEAIGQDAVRTLFELGEADGIVEELERTEARAERLVSLVAKSGHRDAVVGLMSVLKNEQHSQAVRETALRGLIEGGQGAEAVLDLARSGQFPSDLIAVAGSSFSKTLHVIHRGAAAEFFPVPTLRGDEALPGMTEMLVYIGDPERGRQVFNESTCIQCHQIDGEGTAFGPALSGIGAKLAKQGLYESILDPSASVSPNYRGVELTLGSGEIFTGLIVSESDEALVINQQGLGLKSFPRSELSEIRYLDQSVMPTGLQQLMSFNDLVDLVEFLATRRD
jgi:putative heme-binding domain-containing protein